MILKPSANEISITSTANNIGSASIVRVINTGVANTLIFQYANGTQYASMTVTNTTPGGVMIQKRTNDLLIGNSMLAVAVSAPSHTLR